MVGVARDPGHDVTHPVPRPVPRHPLSPRIHERSDAEGAVATEGGIVGPVNLGERLWVRNLG